MRTVLLVSLMVLLVAGFAYAQNDEGYFRGRVGWVDAGDVDSDIGFGVDYFKGKHMFSFDYSTHEETETEDQVANGVDTRQFDFDGASRVNLDIDLMSFSYTYVKRMTDDIGMETNSYYGAGIGYYDADVDGVAYNALGNRIGSGSSSDDSIGFHVLAGMEFGEADEYGRQPWFGEVRYVIGTEFGDFDDADVDGLRLFVGYSF